MHGSHFLSKEYEISSSRLGSSTESTERFKFARSKKRGESSPASKRISFWRIFSTTLFTFILITVGIIRSFGSANILKAITVSQIFLAYIAPKFMIMKRSLTAPNNGDFKSNADNERIMEILPAPLNLILVFNNSREEIKRRYKNNPITHVINPFQNLDLRNANNTMNLFESISFSWCDSYRMHKRYPTKLTIIAPYEIKSCIIGQYRWALKFPRSLIDFQQFNLTSNNLSCPENKNDPFDCASNGREIIRMKYSKLCPQMSELFLACNNRFNLELALSFRPPWNVQN